MRRRTQPAEPRPTGGCPPRDRAPGRGRSRALPRPAPSRRRGPGLWPGSGPARKELGAHGAGLDTAQPAVELRQPDRRGPQAARDDRCQKIESLRQAAGVAGGQHPAGPPEQAGRLAPTSRRPAPAPRRPAPAPAAGYGPRSTVVGPDVADGGVGEPIQPRPGERRELGGPSRSTAGLRRL